MMRALLLAALVGCARAAPPDAHLTSAELPRAAPAAQLASPGAVDAFVLAAAVPGAVPALVRAMADALDAMPDVRFAVAATGVRADADEMERAPRDAGLLVVDALADAVQAAADVARARPTPGAVWDALGVARASIAAIRPADPIRPQRGAIVRALQHVARALETQAAAW